MTDTTYRPEKAADAIERIGERMRRAARFGDVREVDGCLAGIVVQVKKTTAAGKLADLEAELSKRGLT